MGANRTAGRMPNGAARERILDAAESLFALHGLDGVSFRDITARAGVSLSAIHYHFGSKQLVLSDIFYRRARAMVERRKALLGQLPRDDRGRLPLQGILDAFLRPALEVTQGDRDDLFNRLLARLAMEPSEVTRVIMRDCFDTNDLRFVEELARACPGLKREDVHWRFHFLVGAMIYTMSDYRQLAGLSQSTCLARDTTTALRILVESFTASFRADEI